MESREIETGWLDLLLIVVENIKILVLGPIVTSLLALGISFVVPQSYTSQAILALPFSASNVPVGASASSMSTSAQVSAMLVSPLVLDPVVVAMDLLEGSSIEKARAKLGRQVKVYVGKDSLLRLEVTARTPELAQKMANTILTIWLKSTVPSEHEREDLLQRLEYAKTALDSGRRLINRLTKEGGGRLQKPLGQGDVGASVVSLYEFQVRYINDVLSISQVLKGISPDVVRLSPTLPVEPVAPKKMSVLLVTIFVAEALFLLWVFLLQAWRNAAQDTLTSEKQRRLFAALGVKFQ